VSRRARIISFGSAGLLVVVGALCAVLVSSTAGQVLALVLIGLGLILAVGLVFLEVGLSEDRQRARDERPQPRRSPSQLSLRPGRLKRPDLGRSRDHPRRLK
jgi:hypothetical protein